MAEKIDISVNTGGAAADIGKVGDALGDLGQTVSQVQNDLADLAKSINEFISAKAALAGKAPRLLDLTADKAALEELRDSIKDVIAQNPSIKRHIDVANGKNANITAPSQINLASIAGTAQGQAQFIERFITRLIARNQSAGKNKINTGLTSQELLTQADTPRRGPQADKFQKATGLLGAVGKVASQAVQGGAGGWAGHAAGSVLQGAAAAKAAGAGGMGMLKGGGIAAAAFAAYKVASAVDEGLDRAKEEAIGIDKFKRQLGDVGVGFDELRENVRAAADGLGLTYQQSLKLTSLYASTANAGRKDVGDLSAESRIANSFARATGVANEETAKFFGEMRYTGATENPQDSKRMALSMADAIKRTGSSVNADQMLQSISSYAAQIKDATLGSANSLGFADMLSGIMADHGVKAGTAAGLVNQFDASVRSGGVNDAGQAYQFQALDGQRLSFGRFKALQEGGMFGSEESRLGADTLAGDLYGPLEGATKKTTGAKIMENYNRDFFSKGDERSNAAGIDALATQHFGGNHSKAMAFKKSYDKHGGDSGLNTTASMLERAKIEPTNFNAEGITLLSDLAGAKDRPEVEGLRQSMLNRKDLAEKDKERLTKAGTIGNTDEMRLELARVAASMGQEVDQGKQLVDAAVNTENALTKFAGQLIPISIASRDLLGALVEKAAPHSEALSALKRQKEGEQRLAEKQAIADGTLLPADADRLNKAYDDRIEKLLKEKVLNDGDKSLSSTLLGSLRRTDPYAKKDETSAKVDAVNRERGFTLGKYAEAPDKSYGGMVDPTRSQAAVAQGIKDGVAFDAPGTGKSSPPPVASLTAPAASPSTLPSTSQANLGASELKGSAADRAEKLLPEIERVEKDLSLKPGDLAGLVQQESAFRPDVYGKGIDKNGNQYTSKAYGLGQMTPAAIKDISLEFREKFGRDYDQSNTTDQLYAAGMYWRRKKQKFGSSEKANQAYFAGDGGVNGSGTVSRQQVEAYGREVSDKQQKLALLMTKPVNVPQGNPQAVAEAKRQAHDFTFDPIMFNANVTLKDASGKPAADPVALSGKVGKPTGSGARAS